MMWRLAFWWHGWRYRRQARHLARCDWCGQGRCTCRVEPAQDFYGSMTLAGENEWRRDPLTIASGFFAATPIPRPPEVAHSGWWGQTAADLAPETLDAWGPAGPSESYEDWLAEGTDAGPGAGSSLAPGPAPGCPECGQPRLLLNGGPHCPRCGWAEAPDAEPELGPNAARVLARWEARRRERWCLSWDNGPRGQVTGWGLEAAAAA